MKITIMCLGSVILLFSACKKSEPGGSTAAVAYMNYTAGSTWNYERIDSSAATPTISLYTLTSTNRDSTISGASYHIYTNSGTASSEYYAKVGNDYNTFQNLPAALGSTPVVNLYLKDNAGVNTTWSQNYIISYSGLPLTVTSTNTIKETGIAMSVKGKNYTNVTHVQTNLSVSGIPTSALVTDLHFYYAPGVGLIKSTNNITLNYLGITNNTKITTNLVASTLL